MSVGGIVTDTVIVGERVWINTREKPTASSTCAIYVENTPAARIVNVGDVVWWQGKSAYWTPKDTHGKTIGPIEMPLKRIGYSGVERPEPKACDRFEASDYENTMCQRCWMLERDHVNSSNYIPSIPSTL